jgi:CRP-like cAMP-binding protein
MNQELKTAHQDRLKAVARFNAMDEAAFGALVDQGQFIRVDEGHLLFKRSTSDDTLHFLLEGQLNLVNDAFENTAFTTADTAATGAVDAFDIHSVSAVAATSCVIFQIHRGVLDPPKSATQGNWMENLLSTPLFEFIPPNHIQALFKRFEPVAVPANHTIIQQGDAGDYFYVIKSGRVAIDQDANGQVSRVAEMGSGSSFGQDALISDAPRNATVVSLESCELMRLSEADFSELLMSPVIEYVSLEEVEAVKKMHETAPVFIDVRSKLELQSSHISDHIERIPLPLLRNELPALPKEPIYLVIGPKRPKIAEVATYLLNEAGITAYVLNVPEE